MSRVGESQKSVSGFSESSETMKSSHWGLMLLAVGLVVGCGRNPPAPPASPPPKSAQASSTPAVEEVPDGSFHLSIEDVVSTEQEWHKNVRVKMPATMQVPWSLSFGFGTTVDTPTGIVTPPAVPGPTVEMRVMVAAKWSEDETSGHSMKLKLGILDASNIEPVLPLAEGKTLADAVQITVKPGLYKFDTPVLIGHMHERDRELVISLHVNEIKE
jgi:hypothetical protein